jgi:CHAT domain
MPWTIIVASGEGDQLDELMNGAKKIAAELAVRGTDVVPAGSVEDVQIQRGSAARGKQLLIVSASLPGGNSQDQDAAGLELIRSIAREPDAPPCMLVSGDMKHLSVVQEIALCELLYVSCETDYARDCLRLARRLGLFAQSKPESMAPPAGARPAETGAPAAALPSPTVADVANAHRAPQYALVEVHLLNNAQSGFVTLDGKNPQPLKLNQNQVDDLVKESQALAERMNKARGRKQRWQRYSQEWSAEYQRLGERIGNLLWPTIFSRMYSHGYAASNGNVRLRFNLDLPYFDGAWEAIYDQLHKNFVMLGNTVTVARRANQFSLPHACANGEPHSAPAQIDVANGVLKVLIIESDVPDRSTPDGPSDPLWERYWNSLRGKLSALPHIKREVERLRGLARARGGTDKAGRPQPRVEVEVLSPRVGKSLAEIVERRLKDHTRPYNIVHFAGHALFARGPVPHDRRGYLVFSGAQGGPPDAVPIATVADWLEGSGVQLVYLSCCRSSSAAAAIELAARNVPLTIGFNWDLDDGKAVEFARDFYSELLDAEFKVCHAFGKARRNLHGYFAGGDPIWAAPVLIAQPDDWMQVEGVLRPVFGRPPRKSAVRRGPPKADPPSRTPKAA